MTEFKLEMKNISKSFPGVKALDNVQLSVRPGTVHALMGENGAGKSTLMKCLFGIYKMDQGEIFLDGKKVEINNPDEAMEHGVAMVHQELQPVLARSVSENMYLGRFPVHKFGPLQVIDHNTMHKETKKWLSELGLEYNVKAPLSSLSIGQMQMVEIAKAVSHDAKVIIFDEPTSSLSDKEVEFLFKVMGDLKKKGVSMIYISHKMDEIKRISDDISIMRDGTYVGTWRAEDMTTEQIIAKMVGRELTNIYPEHRHEIGETIMEVEDYTSIHEKSFRGVSFSIKKGEILGFGGLVGAQRTELMEGIFGIRHITKGKLKVHGKEVRVRRPKDAMNNGIGMITEDRRGNGIFGCLSIKDNVGVSIYNKFLKAGIMLDHPAINKVVNDNIKRLSIKTPGMKEQIGNLSGGNQQKVILARWLCQNKKIVIFDEPTRGIDVGAKREVYNLMNELVETGAGIIMISSELPEILGMSDRVMIMHEGKIGNIIDIKDATEERILYFATGGINKYEKE